MSAVLSDEPSPLARAEKWFDDIRLIDAVSALTLMLAVFFGFDQPLFKLGIQAALLGVLLRPSLIKNPMMWLVLSVFATIVLFEAWSTADNHKYLFVYWFWVVTIARWVEPQGKDEAVLRAHARFFLVFVFLVAAAQKIASPTYMSGEMFELKLLLDERFKAFGHLLGIDRSIPEAVRLEIVNLKSPLSVYADNAIRISSNDFVHSTAKLITWYDLLVQIAIGLLFIPGKRITDLLGHAVLLFFIFTTYLPAPVFGFGWTLAIYGLTLAKGQYRFMALLYAAAFLAILGYQSPWRDWVLET